MVDPRRIDLVRTPHIKADYHLQLRPGTNVALINALAHVVVDRRPRQRRRSSRERCEARRVREMARLRRARSAIRPKRWKPSPACRPTTCARPRACTRRAATRAIYYGLGVTEHSAGLDDGDGHREPRDGDRQHRPRRRRRESAARPEQRAGLVRHGLVPARVPGLSPRLATTRVRALFEQAWGVQAADRAGPAHPEHVRGRARRRRSRASTSRARTSRSPIRTRST